MAKIQIKSEKLTPLGSIFSIMEQFDTILSPVIDSTLGQIYNPSFAFFPPMKLTDHFTLEEFQRSDRAASLAISNTLDYENSISDARIVFNLLRLCHEVLEPLRARFGQPIRINSGYRCPELNRAVGGAPNSRHMRGLAADIPFKPGYLAYIRDHLPHKELINEGTWIHVGI